MDHVFHTKLSEGRRVAIPAEVCQKLGLNPGDPVALEMHNDGLHLVPYRQIVREVQRAFAPFKTPGVSEIDALIQQRRQEAAREDLD